jgi:hypothetical protein
MLRDFKKNLSEYIAQSTGKKRGRHSNVKYGILK